MSEIKIEKWPIIRETGRPKTTKANTGTRQFTIQDARNTWEIEIAMYMDGCWDIEILGFSKFFFRLNDGNFHCYKREPVRVSDSGIIASHDDRFNLIDDSGNRRTLRLKSFRKYLEKIT